MDNLTASRGLASHRYPIKWLSTFVTVARCGGFSAAARVLNCGQPHVSSQVAALERALGVQLFDRSYQPIHLTPEGRSLLPHAETLLGQLEFLSQASEARYGVHGSVSLGLYPSVSCWLFPRLLATIRRTYPDLGLVLWEGQSVDLGDSLLNGQVDLAVRPLVPVVSSDRLACDVLWQESLVAVVSHSHPLAGQATVAPEQLTHYELVTVGGPDSAMSHQFEVELAFAHAGLRHPVAFQTNQPQTLINLARLGGLVGVTNMLAAQTVDHSGVALIPISGGVFTRTVGLWRRVDGPLSPSIEAVHDAIKRIGPPDFGQHHGDAAAEDTGDPPQTGDH